jgi:predicted DNA-binding transcriptional regulator YafY
MPASNTTGSRYRRSPRLVRPCHFACIDYLWYLFAWDTAKRGLRTFTLHRLTRPQLTA